MKYGAYSSNFIFNFQTEYSPANILKPHAPFHHSAHPTTQNPHKSLLPFRQNPPFPPPATAPTPPKKPPPPHPKPQSKTKTSSSLTTTLKKPSIHLYGAVCEWKISIWVLRRLELWYVFFWANVEGREVCL